MEQNVKNNFLQNKKLPQSFWSSDPLSSGFPLVSAGHPGDAVRPDRRDAGAGAALHHPSLRVCGGRPDASVRVRRGLRPGRAVRPAPQQPQVCLPGDGVSERAAVHRHPEAGLPSSADGWDVHVPSAVRALPGSRGWHLHPGLQAVQEGGSA